MAPVLHLIYFIGNNTYSLALPLQEAGSLPHAGLQITVHELPHPESGRQINIALTALQPLTLQMVELHIPHTFEPTDRLLGNGFQSWTLTDEWLPKHQLKPVKWFAKPLANAFGDYAFFTYPPKKGHIHGWTYGYIKHHPLQPNATITFAGSCHERSAYTGIVMEANPLQGKIRLFKDCRGLQLNNNAVFEAFNLYLDSGNEQEVFARYAQLVKNARKTTQQVTAFPDAQKLPPYGASGFTSWYNYYTRINANIIHQNLRAFAQNNIPLDIFQIDDGWQNAVGDWVQVNAVKFPDGLATVTSAIRQQGYKPGLWLAPFICQRQSEVFKNHPNWLLRHPNGKPVTAGYNTMWQSYMYVLNFYHPQVKDYLEQAFDTILNQWRFELVKPDFLYAVALLPPAHKTRGAVMYEAMQWLRQAVGNKLVLGCGVPLGAAFGATDFCRIGADVHLSWDMPLLKWIGSREGVSTISAIKNTIHRHHLNGKLFFNDPDVSILRNANHRLTPRQQFTLFLVNQIFGSLQFVSDNIGEYSPQTLRLYCSQFPLRQKNIHRVAQTDEVYRAYFTIGNLHYLAFCNLSGKIAAINLAHEAAVLPPAHQNCLYNSHTQTHLHPQNQPLNLMPYESVCLMAVNTQEPIALAGGNAHLFPCADVEHWHITAPGYIQIQSAAITQPPANIWIFSQQPHISLNQWEITQTLPWQQGYLLKFETAHTQPAH